MTCWLNFLSFNGFIIIFFSFSVDPFLKLNRLRIRTRICKVFAKPNLRHNLLVGANSPRWTLTIDFCFVFRVQPIQFNLDHSFKKSLIQTRLYVLLLSSQQKCLMMVKTATEVDMTEIVKKLNHYTYSVRTIVRT